jgi:hypothetical protein
MKSLSKAEFLSKKGPLLWHPIPSWGENAGVFIKQLSMNELQSWRKLNDDEPAVNHNIYIITKLVADENGQPIFTEADIVELDKADFSVLADILVAGLKHNKLGTTDRDEQKKT